MKGSWRILAGIAGLALVVAGCSSDTAEEAQPSASESVAFVEPVTTGANGEEATACDTLSITDEQKAAVASGKYTAALLWHTSGDFVNAVNAGASDKLTELGIKVVATADAAFDEAKQAANVENALAKKPSLILSLPFGASAAAFKPAVDAGTKLVFLSNIPEGYTYGNEYITIATDDLAQMGIKAADELAAAMGEQGEVGYIFHDATYYVTNQRDQAFKATIEGKYPNMTIVAEEGLADPAKAQEIAEAMLARNPNIGGIYVTWAQPAEGVLAALRNAGNTTTKIVTLDLSEPLGLDMVKGGNTAALVADKAYELGACMALSGAIGLAGGTVPPFMIAPALAVTAANIEQGWKDSLNRELPQSIKDAQ